MSLAAVLAAFRDAGTDATPAGFDPGGRPPSDEPWNLVFRRQGDEEWRFTPIAPLLDLPLHPAEPPARRLTAGEIAPLTFGLEACRLVFVDGYFCGELSSLPAPDGDLQAASLRAALAGDAPELERIWPGLPATRRWFSPP